MQLPKYKKKKRIKLKVCQYCGKEFWGHPIAKYCELHRDVKQREKTKKTPEPLDSNNKVYQHEFLEVMEETWSCELEGCANTYQVKIFPKQFVYPRFCDDHRNEFKRKNWIRQKMLEEMRAQQKAALAAARPKAAAKPVLPEGEDAPPPKPARKSRAKSA